MNKFIIYLSPLLLMGMVLLFGPRAFADNGLSLVENGIYDPSTGDINYTISWSVTNSTPLSDLSIGNNVPLGTTFISAGQGGDPSPGNIGWDVGAQQGSANGNVNFTVSVDAAQALNPRVPPLYPFSCGLISMAAATGTFLNSTNIITSTTTDRTDLVAGCASSGSGSGSGSGIPGGSGVSGAPGGGSNSSGENSGGEPGGTSSGGGGSGGGGSSPIASAPAASSGISPSGPGSASSPQVLGASTPSASLPRTGLPMAYIWELIFISASLTFIYRKAYG